MLFTPFRCHFLTKLDKKENRGSVPRKYRHKDQLHIRLSYILLVAHYCLPTYLFHITASHTNDKKICIASINILWCTYPYYSTANLVPSNSTALQKDRQSDRQSDRETDRQTKQPLAEQVPFGQRTLKQNNIRVPIFSRDSFPSESIGNGHQCDLAKQKKKDIKRVFVCTDRSIAILRPLWRTF